MAAIESQEEQKASRATLADRIRRIKHAVALGAKREQEDRQRIADEALLREIEAKKRSLENDVLWARSRVGELKNCFRLEEKEFRQREAEWQKTSTRYQKGIAQEEARLQTLEAELKEVAELLEIK